MHGMGKLSDFLWETGERPLITQIIGLALSMPGNSTSAADCLVP
jgi:hypothetical protein